MILTGNVMIDRGHLERAGADLLEISDGSYESPVWRDLADHSDQPRISGRCELGDGDPVKSITREEPFCHD